MFVLPCVGEVAKGKEQGISLGYLEGIKSDERLQVCFPFVMWVIR